MQLSEAGRLSELEDQIDGLRSTLGKAAGEMSKRKAACNQLKETVANTGKKLERASKGVRSGLPMIT